MTDMCRASWRRRGRALICAGVAVLALPLPAGTAGLVAADSLSDQAQEWLAAVLEVQANIASLDPNEKRLAALAEEFSRRAEREMPACWDWCFQDTGADIRPWLSAGAMPAVARDATRKVLAELGANSRELRWPFERLASQAGPAEPRGWLELYLRAAERRRAVRLKDLRERYPRWVFTKHHTLGGSHYAYTEGQSDAQHERQFDPGAALCRLDLDGDPARVQTLIEDPDGVIRDPDVSWDGRRVLFAWKKSDRADDYHLYEMAVADGSVKQLTHGLGFADYEGVYLPNDDIVFNSTRCVQTVDCWWTEVSNLYACSGMGFQPVDHRQDADATRNRGQDARDTQGQDALATGRYLRRLRGGECLGCRRQGEIRAFPPEALSDGRPGAASPRRMAEVARASCPWYSRPGRPCYEVSGNGHVIPRSGHTRRYGSGSARSGDAIGPPRIS